MPYLNCQAIVLRRSDYRENDRMLTLFSPERGRVDALCRGCKKPKGSLLTASELFTMGEYVLFESKGRKTIQSCNVIESFYPLRLDYERLRHAALMAAACLMSIQPEEPMGHMYILLARSLKRLAYENLPGDAVSAAFLLHFVTINGFKPRLKHCSRCGKAMGEEGGYLLPEEDGICCFSCGKDAPKRSYLSFGQLAWLREVLISGVEKAGELPLQAPLAQLKQYTEAKMESALPEI